MPITWLMIIIVVFFMVRLLRHPRRHPWRERRAFRGTRDLSRGDERRYVAPPRVETPMETLQRRYVEGAITVEQYERELDRLLRTR